MPKLTAALLSPSSPCQCLSWGLLPSGLQDATVVVVCRRGNDSQPAAAHLRDALGATSGITVLDLVGGLAGWSRHQPGFPVY